MIERIDDFNQSMFLIIFFFLVRIDAISIIWDDERVGKNNTSENAVVS